MSRSHSSGGGSNNLLQNVVTAEEQRRLARMRDEDGTLIKSDKGGCRALANVFERNTLKDNNNHWNH
ncbi:unnamed protein product [Ilex paraguariensis]|uniref:Uncharacterized protein n=1 Tax=Ilex paraguariensis TaxID=185542 RepID=A0ABC8TWP5_9AQUA